MFRIEEKTRRVSPNFWGCKKKRIELVRIFQDRRKTYRVSKKISGSKIKRTEFVQIFKIQEKKNIVSAKFSELKKKRTNSIVIWAKKSWKKTKVCLFWGRMQKTKAFDPKKDEVLPLLLTNHSNFHLIYTLCYLQLAHLLS